MICTIKEEKVDLAENRGFADAYAQIGQFIGDCYPTNWIHLTLSSQMPAAPEAAWRLSITLSGEMH